MLRYQLPTGKTVFLTFDEWLNLDDEGLQRLIAKDAGVEVNDPFSDFNPREFKQDYLEDLPQIEGIDKVDPEELKRIKDELKDEFPEES